MALVPTKFIARLVLLTKPHGSCFSVFGLQCKTAVSKRHRTVWKLDETFVGGKARNMHKHIREQRITGTGGKDKTPVIGVLERGGKIRVSVIDSRRKKPLHKHAKDHIEPGAEIFTDALKSYEGLDGEYIHQIIDHAVEYVKGHVHTKGLENFWSLLKRTLGGTYTFVEPYHLFRYLDEQAFRYNERKNKSGDFGRFRHVMRNACGRRLTYKELTGNTPSTYHHERRSPRDSGSETELSVSNTE